MFSWSSVGLRGGGLKSRMLGVIASIGFVLQEFCFIGRGATGVCGENGVSCGAIGVHAV